MLKKENIVFLLFSIISVLIGFLSTYLLSNYFSIEDFGKIQFLLTLLGVGTIFYLSGFDIVIQKQIFNGNDFVVNYVLKNIMPISLIFLLIFGSIYFFYKPNKLLYYVIIILSIGMFDKTTAILNSKLKFKQLRYLEICNKIIILCLVTIAILFKFQLEEYLILFTVTSCIVITIRIVYSKKFLFINKNINKISYQTIREEGMKNTISSSYNILSSLSEKFLLGMLDINSLAIFSIGQLFPKVIKDNVKVILTPTLNTWASKGFEYYSSMIKKYQFTLWVIGITLYVALYFTVDFLISNFFVKYKDSICIAQLLAIPLMYKFVENIKMSSMALSKHTNVFNRINNISNSIKIILVIILIPLYKIYGAVSAIVIVDIMRFVFVTIEYNKLTKAIIN